MFLFYTNFLMGEFERSGMGQKKGLLWALSDLFTASNLAIAAVGAAVGYILIEFLPSFIELLPMARSKVITGAAML